MTDRYFLLGKDVSRSPSPAMMNAAFESLAMEAEYASLSVPEAMFVQEVNRIKRSSFKGMNVTIPFKTMVIPLLSSLDSVAIRIQAVNTVKREDGGKYTGHNTDPDGIVGPLKALSPVLDARNALLIGAGGAARAFCEAMNRLGCRDVGVAVRNVARADEFIRDMEKAFPRMNLTPVPIDDLRHVNHELLFNASPIGSFGTSIPSELKRIIPGTKIVFDAVYRPRDTELLVEAERKGSKVIRGEEMLLHQGMAAFKLWTGKDAPEAAMREALSASLDNGGATGGTSAR
ncbi:MAG: shikimate dehydrogenase [Thaumarchaeota archaeon]|nr:shikimate dehydrogenase [Nitrososphaerota archaeon]